MLARIGLLFQQPNSHLFDEDFSVKKIVSYLVLNQLITLAIMLSFYKLSFLAALVVVGHFQFCNVYVARFTFLFLLFESFSFLLLFPYTFVLIDDPTNKDDGKRFYYLKSGEWETLDGADSVRLNIWNFFLLVPLAWLISKNFANYIIMVRYSQPHHQLFYLWWLAAIASFPIAHIVVYIPFRLLRMLKSFCNNVVAKVRIRMADPK